MASIPTAAEIRAYLEGYDIDATVLTDAWVEARRDKFIIPWIERKCRTKIGAVESRTSYHSGTGSSILPLNARNIVAITAIEYVIGQGDFSPALSSIELVADEGIIKAKRLFEESRTPIFPKGKYNIKVTYTVGSVALEDDMHEAIICLVCDQMLMVIADRTGGGALSVQSFSRNYGKKSKFSNIRADLSRNAVSLLRYYMTGVVSH